MKIIIFFLALCVSHTLLAQIDSPPVGGKAIGMGEAVTSVSDAWSLFNNVAGMASLDQAQILASYDYRFGLSEFQTFFVGTSLPVWKGNAGLSLSRFGDELYNELKIGLAYALEIEQVRLGLKLNYVQVAIQDLNSQGTLVVEFGGQVDITPQITFAGYGYNLNRASLNSDFEEDERIPTILRAGLAYKPIDQLFLTVETEKDIDLPATFRAGIDYQIIENVFLRTGVQAEPFKSHVGIGFSPRDWSFDYGLSNKTDLGLSHQFSVRFRYGKIKNR